MLSAAFVTTALGPLASRFTATYHPSDRVGVERVELLYRADGVSLNRPAEDLAAAERALSAFQATAVGCLIVVTAKPLRAAGCGCGALDGLGCFCPPSPLAEEERCACGATRPGECACEDADYFDAPVRAAA